MNQTHFGPPSFNWGDSFHVKRRKEEESFSSLFEHSVDKWMDGWGRRRKTILVAFILGTFVVFVIEMTTFNELVKSMNLCKKQSIFCRKCELIFLWQKTFFSHSVATPFFIIFWHERASIPRTNARRAKSWPQPKAKKLMVSCRRLQVAALFCTRWRIIFAQLRRFDFCQLCLFDVGLKSKILIEIFGNNPPTSLSSSSCG